MSYAIKKIISFDLGTPIEKVNKKMLDKGISQIPIFDEDICIGMITDKKISGLVGSDVSNVTITPKMLEIPPPVVNTKMPLQSLRGILDFFPVCFG